MSRFSYSNEQGNALTPYRQPGGAWIGPLNNTLQPPFGHNYAQMPQSSPHLLAQIWRAVRAHRYILLGSALLGAVLGYAITIPMTPRYRARTTLDIQVLNDSFLNMRSLSPTAPGGTVETNLQSQIKILQSETMRDRTVATLNRTGAARPFTPQDVLSEWRRKFDLYPPPPLSRDYVLADAAESLKVRPLGQTRIIEITSEAVDPQVAAQYANTLAAEFINANLEARWKVADTTSQWFSGQLQATKKRLEDAEQQLQAYARSSSLIFTSDKDSITEEKLRQVQLELSKAEAERILKQSQYDLVSRSATEFLPMVLDSLTAREYQIRLADLRRQMAELSSTLTPEHYRVKRVQAQIAELESGLQKERAAVVQRMRNEYQAAEHRERLLKSAYANEASRVTDEASRSIRYNMLKHEVDASRQLYDTLLQRVKEAGMASALQASTISVVDPAKPPLAPMYPNRASTSAIGLIAATLSCFALVVLRNRLSESIHNPGDIATQLGMREVGLIPSATVDGPQNFRQKLLGSFRKTTPDGSGPAAGDSILALGDKQALTHVELAAWNQNPSLVAESFRSAMNSILFTPEAQPRVMAVTSPEQGDGKTTVTTNLGIALAEINRRVILIDGDLRRPRLHKIFNQPNDRGLCDLLKSGPDENVQIESFIRETHVPGLYILPSGRDTTNSVSRLLHSPRLAHLLPQLRQKFDFVLIDTPPMGQVSDARVIGRITDAVLLVLRTAKTTREMALACRMWLLEDGSYLLGTILNDWNPKVSGRYGYYQGYPYYESRHDD